MNWYSRQSRFSKNSYTRCDCANKSWRCMLIQVCLYLGNGLRGICEQNSGHAHSLSASDKAGFVVDKDGLLWLDIQAVGGKLKDVGIGLADPHLGRDDHLV